MSGCSYSPPTGDRVGARRLLPSGHDGTLATPTSAPRRGSNLHRSGGHRTGRQSSRTPDGNVEWRSLRSAQQRQPGRSHRDRRERPRDRRKLEAQRHVPRPPDARQHLKRLPPCLRKLAPGATCAGGDIDCLKQAGANLYDAVTSHLGGAHDLSGTLRRARRGRRRSLSEPPRARGAAWASVRECHQRGSVTRHSLRQATAGRQSVPPLHRAAAAPAVRPATSS